MFNENSHENLSPRPSQAEGKRINQSGDKLFNNQKAWLNSKEAAEYLSISVENLRVKISRGQIRPDGKLGRTLRFSKEKLDQLIKAPFKEFSND